MSTRIYMVASFAMMTILAAVLTLNWWMVIPDNWWPLRLACVAFGVGMTLLSALMIVVAATSEYR